MGRRRRIDWPGAWHHVMNRGAGRRLVFRDDDDRNLAVTLFAEFDERFGIEVHAYCLMGNHFHLLVRSREGRLSEAMKWFGSEFTKRVNARRSVDGAIFRGRFHSVLVERDAHLTWLFRYINANPLDLGWEPPLDRYPWSSLGAVTGARRASEWLNTEFIHAHFGTDPSRLAAYVESSRCDVGSVDVRSEATLTAADIVSAVHVVSGPGPDVCTAAEIRAAQLLIAAQVGVGDDELSITSGLRPTDRDRQLQRAHLRFAESATLRRLVERTVSILSSSERQPSANGV